MAGTKLPVGPVWAESGDKTAPSAGEVQAGWPNSATPPSRQRMNWILALVHGAVRYLTRRGLPDWDAAETYSVGDKVQFGTKVYSCILATANEAPDTHPTKWAEWGLFTSDYYALLASVNGRTWASWSASAATSAGGNLFDSVTAVAGDTSILPGSSIVIPAAGVYSFKAIGAITAGTMGFSLYVNGALRRDTTNVNHPGQAHIVQEFQEQLAAGDAVQFKVSGAATVTFSPHQIYVTRIR